MGQHETDDDQQAMTDQIVADSRRQWSRVFTLLNQLGDELDLIRQQQGGDADDGAR